MYPNSVPPACPAEAHNSAHNLFGFPRLRALLKEDRDGLALIDFLLEQLAAFTGTDWEQEDDITLVTLQRSASQRLNTEESMRVLGEWSLPSEPGNERLAMQYVAEAVQPLNLPNRRLEQLKTAVAEATMNAMEHGNNYQPDVPVTISVLASETALSVHITDQGGSQPFPGSEPPDLEAKLAELQPPRGWGLFLIQNMVDDMRVTCDRTSHTVELIIYLEGENHVD